MANPLVGQGYDKYIGTRQKPGQPQTEFYNLETDYTYKDPNELLRAVQPWAGNQIVDETNVFDVLKAGYTPRDTALNQIKSDINTYQQQIYGQPELTNQRKSSSITESIVSEQGNYDGLTSEYNELRKKLTELSAPNYQQAYNDIRSQSGITQIENDFAGNQKTIRELPYVNRQNFGNAAVATEGQLAADTQQKGIPLEIQQANLIDRLKLAQDFINNSLKFKELDQNASRQSLSDGINTVLQAIDLSRTNLNDLLARQKAQDERDQLAQQFAYENRVSKPFYEVGGTVYRTSDRMPAHDPKEYIAMGGKGDFSDVQKLDIANRFENQLALAELKQREDQFGFEREKFAQTFDFEKYKFSQELGLKRLDLEQQIAAAAGSGGLSKDQVDNLFKVQSQMGQDKVLKDFEEVATFYDRMQVGAKQDSAAGDMTMIFSYMKMLDPGSVVREGEFANAQNAGGIEDRIRNLYNKTLTGERLSANQRNDFLNTGGSIYDAAEAKSSQRIDFYSKQLSTLGIDPSLGIKDYGSGVSEPNNTTPFTGPINQNNPAYKELKTQFPNATDAEIRAAFGQPTGTLSQKYESGGNPGAIGKDNTGGWSYGTYQLAHSNATRFLEAFPVYGKWFKGLRLGTEAFNKKWKEVASKDPEGFKQAQHQYIQQTHYQPQVEKLKKIGFDVDKYSVVLKDVIWSTAVQHGPATDVITSVIKRLGKAASETDLVKAIYDERWSGGKRFAKSTQNVKNAVKNRFFGKGGELQTALSRLKSLIS